MNLAFKKHEGLYATSKKKQISYIFNILYTVLWNTNDFEIYLLNPWRSYQYRLKSTQD